MDTRRLFPIFLYNQFSIFPMDLIFMIDLSTAVKLHGNGGKSPPFCSQPMLNYCFTPRNGRLVTRRLHEQRNEPFWKTVQEMRKVEGHGLALLTFH
ncbi:hypothetical protein ACE6H2_002405 [Prunus campanulata]